MFLLHPFLYLLVCWACGIGPWPGRLSSFSAIVIWLGHLTCKIVSEMTYNVSSGTLNPTIPYRDRQLSQTRLYLRLRATVLSGFHWTVAVVSERVCSSSRSPLSVYSDWVATGYSTPGTPKWTLYLWLNVTMHWLLQTALLFSKVSASKMSE